MKKVLPWAIVGVLVIGVVLTFLKLRNPEPVKDADAGVGETAGDNQGDAADTAKKNPPPPPGNQKGTTADRPENVAAVFFSQASRASDPAVAADLYRQAIEAAPSSDVAVQAAACLGEYFCKNRETTKAIEYLQKALAGKISDVQRRHLQEMLDGLTSGAVFADAMDVHIVRTGDRLEPLGREYDIPYQLIMKLNDIKNPNLIRRDQRLKIIQGPFHAVLEKSKFTLSVYLGDKYVKSYKVGLGKDNSTPEGEFAVMHKSPKPVWTAKYPHVQYGDPENPLGTRWIGFSKEYGIHGTWEPETVGKQASKGCVRMLNTDVEELYDLLVPGKSKVTIKP